MSEFRTQIEELINSKKDTDYIVSILEASHESSPELKYKMIAELISLICALEDENRKLEENCENLTAALNQLTAAYEKLYSKQAEKKSLWRRISSCFNK